MTTENLPLSKYERGLQQPGAAHARGLTEMNIQILGSDNISQRLPKPLTK